MAPRLTADRARPQEKQYSEASRFSAPQAEQIIEVLSRYEKRSASLETESEKDTQNNPSATPWQMCEGSQGFPASGLPSSISGGALAPHPGIRLAPPLKPPIVAPPAARAPHS